ncbi:MAG: hypothetical protein LBK13_01040, partial [Spirochaetales bacterium]|nr:hypothetical protein [Spirochaetales bacterium]
LETGFSNWNARDVIGHINGWIKFSEGILEAIKSKRSLEDVSHVDIEQFNKTNYEKYKNETLENVVNESKIILEKYKTALDSFNEEELSSNKFLTGFSWAPWKYMAMDLCIHPLVHIMYHYIKRGDYNEFIKEAENSRTYFMEYSGNTLLKEYYFGDLFNNKEEKEKRFRELKETGENNKFIEEIIKINME